MSSEDRPPQGVLPVTNLDDLSRADLGRSRVVNMIVHEEFADRAQDLYTMMAEQEQSDLAAQARPGESGSPFHGEEKERHEE